VKNWESESEILTRLRELTAEVRRLREDLKDELRPTHRERMRHRLDEQIAGATPPKRD
jgi:uncharacterized protein involved in exopolysaccharide biosynthesis